MQAGESLAPNGETFRRCLHAEQQRSKLSLTALYPTQPQHRVEQVVCGARWAARAALLRRRQKDGRRRMALRILTADDNPAALRMVKTLLEMEGFEVVGEAANGREAIELADALRPDIAILDLAMPQVNGLEAARKIRETCPKTRLILLSAHNTEQLVVSAFQAGVRGYVVKTDGARDLIRAIREISLGRTFLSPSASRFIARPYLPSTRRRPDRAPGASGRTPRDFRRAPLFGLA